MQRLGLVVVALILGAAMLASPTVVLAQSKPSCAQPMFEWTIQKLKIKNGVKILFVKGSNGKIKQYVPITCRTYEVPDKTDPSKKWQIDEADGFKYHFWHEGWYEIEEREEKNQKHVFFSLTLIEGFRAIVFERYNNKPINKAANVVSVHCRKDKDWEGDKDCYRAFESGDCAIREEYLTADHWLSPEFEALVTARLAVISDGALAIEKATESDQFGALPANTAYAKLVIVEKATGARHLVLLRSDNNPTVEYLR